MNYVGQKIFFKKKKRHIFSYTIFFLALWFCNKVKNKLFSSSINTQIPFLYYQYVFSARRKKSRRKANTYFMPPRYLIIAEQYAVKGAWPVSVSFQLVWHCNEKTELENCTSRCILKWLQSSWYCILDCTLYFVMIFSTSKYSDMKYLILKHYFMWILWSGLSG